MSTAPKKSSVGFAVIKLQVEGKPWLLMRKNLKWSDISFIGGHEDPRDGGSLLRTAKRELLEEVPHFRTFKGLTLETLVDNLRHGPVFSRSAQAQVLYTFGFFLVRFSTDPSSLINALGRRTPNILITLDELARNDPHISRLVGLLDQSILGGLSAIPLSWPEDLGATIGSLSHSSIGQKELCL